MKKFLSLIGLCVMSSCLYADPGVNVPPKFKLDKVDFVVSHRLWHETKTALLVVGINTTLQNSDMVKTRAELLKRLNQLANGNWQITQFNRSQDSSGLEKLYVSARLRVSQSSLSSVYPLAKKISQPGMAFNILQIDFKPSFEELELVKRDLRNKIYQDITIEVANLNKNYPEEHYTVHKINFYEGEPPMFDASAAPKALNMVALAAKPESVAVSNEIKLYAYVELASNREGK